MNCQPAPLKKSLAWSLVSFFLFRRVSLAEYILVLRVYSLLLQMTCFTRASARATSTRRVTRTRSHGCDHLLVYFPECFCGNVICKTGSRIWTKCVCKLCFRYFLNLVCNNLRLCGVVSLFSVLVKCNVWWVMLNDAILVINRLVWNPSWFRLTTGIIWA
jgi:hypothetical protein